MVAIGFDETSVREPSLPDAAALTGSPRPLRLVNSACGHVLTLRGQNALAA
jgi:hypothetical protein